MSNGKFTVYISDTDNPYVNLAAESALVERGGLCLFLWRNDKTVVIGKHQNPYAECNLSALLTDGGHLARRPTGGGAVYHDLGNLNFSFIVPAENYDVKRQLGVIADAVAEFGIAAEITGRNDVTAAGRKFSGNAFLLGRVTRLHHGTVLIKTDADALNRYLLTASGKTARRGVKSVASKVVNLSELNPSITAEGLMPKIIAAAEKTYETTAEYGDFAALKAENRVKELTATFSSDGYLYGGWAGFSATKSCAFDWGFAEIQTEEERGKIRVTVATDGIYPEAVNAAVSLFNDDTPLPALSADELKAANDILNLLRS